MATVWDNLRLALEYVSSDLTVIIKRKEKRKGAIMGRWQSGIYGKENNYKQTWKTKQDFDTGVDLTSWAEAMHYLRSPIYSRGLCSAIYFWRAAASTPSWRIPSLRSSAGVGFQLYQLGIFSFTVKYVLKNWFPGVSLLYLLTVPYKSPTQWGLIKSSFSLIYLPIDKISWLKIIKN